MISNQVLQNTIDGLKGITRIDLCVIDTEGKVLASTFPEADAYTGSVLAFAHRMWRFLKNIRLSCGFAYSRYSVMQ